MVISDSVTDTDNNFFNCYYQDMNLTFNEWKDSLYNAKHSTTLLSFNGTVDSSNLLAEIVSYIGKNYADCNLCTDFMSNKYGFSSRYISKLFKSEIGKSFSEYLTQYRIEKAKILLRTTSESISQIYRQCGFVSEKTFFRSFSKYENVTPGKYRELNQQCTY